MITLTIGLSDQLFYQNGFKNIMGRNFMYDITRRIYKVNVFVNHISVPSLTKYHSTIDRISSPNLRTSTVVSIACETKTKKKLGLMRQDELGLMMTLFRKLFFLSRVWLIDKTIKTKEVADEKNIGLLSGQVKKPGFEQFLMK